MALTEEQRNPWRAIVAGGDYNLTSQDWEDLLTELDSLYTEATIAQPASAPSEQKPIAWATTNEDGDYAMLFFDKQEALSYSGDDEPIGLAPVSLNEAPIAPPASEQKPVEDFIKWGGGACPVGENDLVDVIFVDGDVYKSTRAGGWGWNSDQAKSIVAYRPLGNVPPQPDYKAQRNELREQVECSSIVIDNLESRLNKATVKLAAMKQQRDAFLDAAKNAVTVAESAYEAWDNDQDAKVGKYLKALCGCLPGYDKRTDELHAAIASVKGGA